MHPMDFVWVLAQCDANNRLPFIQRSLLPELYPGSFLSSWQPSSKGCCSLLHLTGWGN